MNLCIKMSIHKDQRVRHNQDVRLSFLECGVFTLMIPMDIIVKIVNIP